MLEANERKTKSVRRLGTVDIAALRERVLAIPEEMWAAENATKPNRFGALDTTRHIVFRFVKNRFDCRHSDDGPLCAQWKDVLLPVMEGATQP